MIPFRLIWPALPAMLALAGCVENADDIKPVARAIVPAGIARGANVVFSIDGAPAPVIARFTDAMLAAAARLEIPITDGANAKYFVHGYLTAYPDEKGTAVGYVWDVFDAGKHLAKRVDDVIVIKAKAPDGWSAVDDAALTSLATRSADDLAAFLGGTPEAVAAAKTAPAAPARPLAYAPVQ